MRKLLVLVLAIMALPTPAASQDGRVGVVATVVGTATVARAAVQEPTLLNLRDDVFLYDRITTGEQSFVRVLLAGKATVTARERSVLTITESPGVSTTALSTGRIAVAVSKDKMKPGEAVEIRLPNVVVAIRGTVVVAEASPASVGPRSTVTILRGVVEVMRLDTATGQPVGSPVRVGALQRISVVGSDPLPAPENITAAEARRVSGQFTVIPHEPPPAARAGANQVATDLAIKDALLLSKNGGDNGRRGGTRLADAFGGAAMDGSAVAIGGSVGAVVGGASVGGSIVPTSLTLPGGSAGLQLPTLP